MATVHKPLLNSRVHGLRSADPDEFNVEGEVVDLYHWTADLSFPFRYSRRQFATVLTGTERFRSV